MRQRISKILVTGGAGFIGSEFVRQSIRMGDKVTVVDRLTYAGDLQRLKEVKGKYHFYRSDICNKNRIDQIFKKEKPDIIVHFAAETHVDRSIQNASNFIEANIHGTQNLVDVSMKNKIRKFLHISTDEVYGESKNGLFNENARLKPNNPYAASKASAEFLIKAAMHTHRFPAIIIRPANNYGPWQYPEKFVPVVILKALKKRKIPVYGKGRQIREWLFVSDCAKAIYKILKKGKIGETYNVGTNFEQNNLVTAKTILRLMGKSVKSIQFVKDRPGHDYRYSVNCTKLRKLGWKPETKFQNGIRTTVDWYKDNQNWLENKLIFLENYWRSVYQP